MRIFYLLITFSLFSCAASFKNVDMKQKNYEDVSLNVQLSSELGEKLITKGSAYYQDALLIKSISNFKINTVQFPYTEGNILPLLGQTNQHDFYFIPSNQTNYMQIGLAKSKKDGKIKAFINSMNGLVTKDVEKLEVEQTEYIDKLCESCFKKEFVYNGKSGSTLKFIYREYINDMARPAFNQDLQYDLNDGNIVGIKGLRLEVIKATNTNIEYKVLNSFTN